MEAAPVGRGSAVDVLPLPEAPVETLGEEPPGGGAEVLAEQTVEEEVGRGVDAHQQVRRVDDELDVHRTKLEKKREI